MQPLVISSRQLKRRQTEATAELPLELTTAPTLFALAALRVRVRRAGFLLACALAEAGFLAAIVFFTVRRVLPVVARLRWLSTRAHSSSLRVEGLLPWA